MPTRRRTPGYGLCSALLLTFAYLAGAAIFPLRAADNGDEARSINQQVDAFILFDAAQAYAKIGDETSSKALMAAATEILGPTVAARRPQPKWL